MMIEKLISNSQHTDDDYPIDDDDGVIKAILNGAADEHLNTEFKETNWSDIVITDIPRHLNTIYLQMSDASSEISNLLEGDFSAGQKKLSIELEQLTATLSLDRNEIDLESTGFLLNKLSEEITSYSLSLDDSLLKNIKASQDLITVRSSDNSIQLPKENNETIIDENPLEKISDNNEVDVQFEDDNFDNAETLIITEKSESVESELVEHTSKIEEIEDAELVINSPTETDKLAEIISQLQQVEYVDITDDIYKTFKQSVNEITSSISSSDENFEQLKINARRELRKVYQAALTNGLIKVILTINNSTDEIQKNSGIDFLQKMVSKAENSVKSNRSEYLAKTLSEAHALIDKHNTFISEQVNLTTTEVPELSNNPLEDENIPVDSKTAISRKENGIAKGIQDIPLYEGKTTLLNQHTLSQSNFGSNNINLIKKSIGYLNKYRGFSTHIQVNDKTGEKEFLAVHNLMRHGNIIEHNNSYEFDSFDNKATAKIAVKLASKRGWNQITAWGNDMFMQELTNRAKKKGIEVIPINTSLLKTLETVELNTPITLQAETSTSREHVVDTPLKSENPQPNNDEQKEKRSKSKGLSDSIAKNLEVNVKNEEQGADHVAITHSL